MSSIDDRYISHFVPLVQQFIEDLPPLSQSKIGKGMPEPFLPLYGRQYEQSALRLVLIGQDTRGWGDLRQFIAEEKAHPGHRLRAGLDEFRSHDFTQWGPRRQSFWGFAMMFLAALYGQEDWGAMKQGAMGEVLDSFAWGNANAIELFGTTAAHLGVSSDYWNEVRRAGERFNRFGHILETLRPNVAVIMHRGLNLDSYFEGYKLEPIRTAGRLCHYRLAGADVDIFHTPHPGSMNRIEGTDHFRDQLLESLQQQGLNALFSKFLAGQQEGADAMEYLARSAPRAEAGKSKYECVAWVADELKKRQVFMSVPTLCSLLNDLGHRTNYGSPFSGGRGSYRLVSGAYHRMQRAGFTDRAENVAVAFRRPNFQYAYK